MIQEATCHICGSQKKSVFNSFEYMGRATSDCKPWPSGGKLFICRSCGMVQKVVDRFWEQEIESIYADYELFHQSVGNVEQLVFDSHTGVAVPRTVAIINFVLNQLKGFEPQNVIDVGCGVGNTLKSLSKFFSTAKLFGFEPHLRDKDGLLRLPFISDVYTDMQQCRGYKFQLMTMIHVLEHIARPVSVLQDLSSYLSKDSYLIIAVPDYTNNPFDLIIADHVSHFSLDTLEYLLNISGFGVEFISNQVINKEIVAICKPAMVSSARNAKYAEKLVKSQLSWMSSVIDKASHIASCKQQFGVFGTSIAASWLYGQMRDKVDFFVDEAPERTGRNFHGKPVFSPDEIPSGSHTYVCLQPSVAPKVVERLSDPRYILEYTPDYEA